MSRASSELGDIDLDHAMKVATEAAESAGRLVGSRISTKLKIREKGQSGDIITDLDLEAESIICRIISTEYPEHRIFAEESGETGGEDDTWNWLVDPLDGTNNLAVGLPILAVGIALCRNGFPVLSVVNEPIGNRTWRAMRGGGAFGPEGRIAPASSKTLHPKRPVVVAWTQGYDVPPDDYRLPAAKLLLDQKTHRVLQLWAPLIGWCMLARGDIDGFVGYSAGPLDLHPGVLLATEAGMPVVDFGGGEFENRYIKGIAHNFIAARPEVLPSLLDLISRTEDIAQILSTVSILSQART